jgi:hypothetical protein
MRCGNRGLNEGFRVRQLLALSFEIADEGMAGAKALFSLEGVFSGLKAAAPSADIAHPKPQKDAAKDGAAGF